MNKVSHISCCENEPFYNIKEVVAKYFQRQFISSFIFYFISLRITQRVLFTLREKIEPFNPFHFTLLQFSSLTNTILRSSHRTQLYINSALPPFFSAFLSVEELQLEVSSWKRPSILFLRIAQNMSHFNLLSDTMLRAPEAPNLTGTLLLIETNKYFPPSSAVSLDKNVPEIHQDLLDSQISLGQNLKKEVRETISSTSTIKKKKAGCTCKKTKCLKMYCQCFSSDRVCGPDCSCFGCSNDHQHSELVARAKEAVKAKNLSASKQAQGKGCNCKKSQCQKKYCECYNAGLACGSDCKCQQCGNCQVPTQSGQRIPKGSTSSFLE